MAYSAPRLSDGVDKLVTVVDLIRYGHARTRPELSRLGNLSRASVTQQLSSLADIGLVSEGEFAPSTGGRAARSLVFSADAGLLLVAEMDAAGITAGVTDLSGQLLVRREERFNVREGPQAALKLLSDLFEMLLADASVVGKAPWGVGLGLPGPVEHSSGSSTSLSILPGWHGYPIRQNLARRLELPVWIDNDANLMALGELRNGRGRGEENIVYLNIGSGVGAGIVCGGRLYRGHEGCAGEIGHVRVREDSDVECRCGKLGCLDALAGGEALARDGTRAAHADRSSPLATVLADGRTVTAEDITRAARQGDPVSLELVLHAGRLVGEVLSVIVNFFNPQLILVGGCLTGAADILVTAVRESLYRYSLSIATRHLEVISSPLGDNAGLHGAAAMVADELFTRSRIGHWIRHGNPAKAVELLMTTKP
jgi:glucokinase-like ROK family protein